MTNKVYKKLKSILRMITDTAYRSDIEVLKDKLSLLPQVWDGKSCILELKLANFNWKQMEWWGFYLEHKVKEILSGSFTFPGHKYGKVVFDLRKTINWDLKGSVAINHDDNVILNDKEAMDASILKDGYHGEIIALVEPEYDTDNSFKDWHSALKGGKSKYEKAREERTSNSRRRKKGVKLIELIFIVFRKKDLPTLGTMNQGRNSNGSPRKPKYMLDLRQLHKYEHYKLKFQ